ncbi:MAG: tRNA (adenosine(37)-N6)-threonylcarbamoyltransferase complex ATPase subunit type 1 TsaE [Candidatus Cloacimonetes bacterium]|nr:tRNA (adenosine(37)-N6)-threonylcarbamoyltransferase complex ATPase subunit type 1 TsaE [Candidatus Cloacimonadota bacterium]
MKNLDKTNPLEKISQSLKNTSQMAKNFSSLLKLNDVVTLYGPLGSGKTFFVKAIAKSFGAKNVSSPSFVILNEYKTKIPIYHFDFYRLKNEEEIANIGFCDFLNQRGIFFIEWPEMSEKMLPKNHYKIFFEILNENSRKITIKHN